MKRLIKQILTIFQFNFIQQEIKYSSQNKLKLSRKRWSESKLFWFALKI